LRKKRVRKPSKSENKNELDAEILNAFEDQTDTVRRLEEGEKNVLSIELTFLYFHHKSLLLLSIIICK